MAPPTDPIILLVSDSTQPSRELASGREAERRRSRRVRALHHIVVSKNGDTDEASVTVGRTIDVSSTGVRIQSPGHLCIDDVVRLEIAVEDRVIEARGRVVRSARIGELIEAGIEFTVIADADRRALTS